MATKKKSKSKSKKKVKKKGLPEPKYLIQPKKGESKRKYV